LPASSANSFVQLSRRWTSGIFIFIGISLTSKAHRLPEIMKAGARIVFVCCSSGLIFLLVLTTRSSAVAREIYSIIISTVTEALKSESGSFGPTKTSRSERVTFISESRENLKPRRNEVEHERSFGIVENIIVEIFFSATIKIPSLSSRLSHRFTPFGFLATTKGEQLRHPGATELDNVCPRSFHNEKEKKNLFSRIQIQL
jgi:hypothetical protein